MSDGVRMLLIDNYDSFTYNVVQAFAAMGADVIVHRNDAITVSEARDIQPTHLVISPGPGRPADAGISTVLIHEFAERIPVFGICLGHQCLASVYGGEIVRAPRIMHGKTSMVSHDGSSLFRGLPDSFPAGRYHSLTAQEKDMPGELEVTAKTERGEIMAIRHRELPVYGVQFHPESVLTPDGNRLMANFIGLECDSAGLHTPLPKSEAVMK